MATVIDMQEAAAHFSSLIARMEQGEEIVIARGTVEIAKLVPVMVPELPTKRPDRVPGLLKGKISIPDDFFDPMTEEELALWEGK